MTCNYYDDMHKVGHGLVQRENQTELS